MALAEAVGLPADADVAAAPAGRGRSRTGTACMTNQRTAHPRDVRCAVMAAAMAGRSCNGLEQLTDRQTKGARTGAPIHTLSPNTFDGCTGMVGL